MDFLRRLLRIFVSHKIVSLTLLLVALGGTFYARRVADQTRGSLSEPLARGSIVDSVYGIGTVMALRSYQIRSGVTSTIFDLYVNEGANVAKGAKLVNVDGHVYVAPFAGTVTDVPYKSGENVFASQSVLTIVDLRDRYVIVSLEQQAALRVRAGQAAKLSFDTRREHAYEGRVESVYSNDAGFLARISVRGLPDDVLPGMTADVAIAIRESAPTHCSRRSPPSKKAGPSG